MVDILELNLFSEDVYAFAVEEGRIVFWGSAFLETSAADGENLAHAVSSVVDAVVIRPCSPDSVSSDYFNDDAVIRHREQMLAVILVSEALLPDAPEHPLVTKGLVVGTATFPVFCTLVCCCCISAPCGKYIFLYSLRVFTFPTPLSAEIIPSQVS